MSKSIKKPFFSVIICTFNRAEIITTALESLIRQTDKDWEAIIVDDGSMDHTREVVQPYLSKYPMLYHRKAHEGLAATRNKGIALSKGQYLTFLDTDDRYKPTHLHLRHDILKKYPPIDLLHSNVTIIGNPYLPDKHNPQKQIHINDCVVGGTFFIKKDMIPSSLFFQERYSDDSFFLENMEVAGRKIFKLNAPTYIYYRNREDSLCNQIETEPILHRKPT